MSLRRAEEREESFSLCKIRMVVTTVLSGNPHEFLILSSMFYLILLTVIPKHH